MNLARRAVLFAGWGLALALSSGVLAGDKVTFSGSDNGKQAVDSTRPSSRVSRSLQDPFDAGSRRSSSLEGVTAPPFQPAQPTTAPLSPRELQMLQDRRDWMMQTPSDGRYSEQEVNKALGVQGQDFDANAAKSASKGWLMRYYEQNQPDKTPATKGLPETLRGQPMGMESMPRIGTTTFGSTRDASSLGGNPAKKPEGFDQIEGMAGLETLSQDRDWLARNRAGTSKATSYDPARDLGDRFGLDLRQDGSDDSKGLRSITKVLGQDPIRGSLSLPNDKLDTGINSVNTLVDPTREPLNPVLGKTGPAMPKQPFEPGFAESQRPEKSFQLKPSDALQGIVGNSYLAPGQSKLDTAPKTEQRSIHNMKTQLEMTPRRGL